MDNSSAILIVNMHAGRHRSKRSQDIDRFCETLKRHNVQVEVVGTDAPGDATRAARYGVERGINTIIVSGGDGTINEALQGIIQSKVRLAIWPTGTANVLARELKIPFDINNLAEVIARGHTQKIYPGCAIKLETEERRYFFLMAGIGLDASIVHSVRAGLKRRVGEAAFWYAGLEHFARWQPQLFNVEIDDESFEATFAAVGKAPHYGGNLSITPHAKLDEPSFEVCIVSSQNRFNYLRLLAHAVRGSLNNLPAQVQLIKTTELHAFGNSMVQLDGELIGQLPMTFKIVPTPIEVIVP